jgi:hypothetical protein
MSSGIDALIDPSVLSFLRGPTSAFLGTCDTLGTPDATRIIGLVTVDDSHLRVLISEQAETARRNAIVGARVAVIVTDITTYRSVQWKGRIAVVDRRSPGDIALIDHHITTFEQSSETVGIASSEVWKLFATDGIPFIVEVDEVWDQTPGSNAGHQLGGSL